MLRKHYTRLALNICRFCHQKQLVLLYLANRSGSSPRKVEDYACTNSAFGIHGPIVKCQNCSIIYVDEPTTQQEISTYYEMADDLLYFAEQKAREITFRRYLQKLEEYYPHCRVLLDIGTNTGLFVKLAQNNNWDAVGLEPNKWAVAYAKKTYGVSLINKPFTKNIFKADYFDVITMWDVIEHFTNPVEEIKKVRWLLKPGGVLALSTVDPESLLARIMGTRWPWYMEMHRVFLSQTAAKNYLTEAGFTKIIFTPHWRNLSLGYLSTRLKAINPSLAKIAGNLFSVLGISKTIVPYYANDLYDCYAFK